MREAGSSVGSCAMVSNQPLKAEGTARGADSSMRHNNFMNFDKELDARGLNCPLPILKAKKALTDLRSGQVLKVLATDPGAVKDFQSFSRQTGHELLSHGEANREFTFFMRKK
jgi:tRNA 2-thiouridine synthesizing protein A